MAPAYKWDKAPALPGFDPASAWCLGEGRAFLPMLWDETEDTNDLNYVAGMDAGCPPGKTPFHVFLASDLAKPGKAQEALDTLTDAGMKDPRLHLMPLRTRMLPGTGASKPIAVHAEIQDGGPPAALIGVIDHAINVLHERFRAKDGASRVAFHWDQGGAYQKDSTVPFGQEWSGVGLTRLLNALGGDDVAGLRKMGALDFTKPGERPLAYRQSHGTGVLDVAAGEAPANTDEATPQILAVSLPPVVARESSGALLTFFYLQAFEFLLARARDLNAKWKADIPLYVNASFGISGGPRLGEHPIDLGMKGLLEDHKAKGGCPVTIVFPAGNRNLAQGHAQGGDTLKTRWHVQPGDRTSNYIDARVLGKGDVSLSLKAPFASDAVTVELKADTPQFLKVGDAVIGRAILEHVPGETALRLGIALAPTDAQTTGRAVAVPGRWELEVSGKGAEEIEAWILRDDSPPGFSDGGRQSYFDDDAYQKYNETTGDIKTRDDNDTDTIQRRGALNAMATEKDRIVIGGYSAAETLRKQTLVPAFYSSAPLPVGRALGVGEAVTVSAISERSRVVPGILAAATLSGGALALNGTSVAAPQAVRALAKGGVGPDQAAAYLKDLAGDRRSGALGGLPPENRFAAS